MDILGMTIIFIAVSTTVSAILKVIRKDKCLKDFNDFNVSVITAKDEKYYGKMRLESTGMELIYDGPYTTIEEEIEASYILYKKEYPNIKVIARMHDDLTEEGKEKREEALRRSYHPNMIRRWSRKFLNICNTVKGAISEVIGLLIRKAQKTASEDIQSQDQQIAKMKDDMLGKPKEFDPLLENHIGNIIILEVTEKEEPISYHGVLKEYTAEFIEIMDVDFNIRDQIKKSDLIFPRKNSIVRHLGE